MDTHRTALFNHLGSNRTCQIVSDDSYKGTEVLDVLVPFLKTIIQLVLFHDMFVAQLPLMVVFLTYPFKVGFAIPS